jgi:hypothetical protein
MSIPEIIQKLAKDVMQDSRCRVCKVLAVDEATCTVETLDTETELSEVRLQAESGNGIYLKPAIDSFVIVAPIADFEYVVIMYSALQEIQFLDGSYGGLTKTQELKTQLDKTNEVVQAIVDSLKNWVVSPSDGGAALKTFFNAMLGSKVVGNYSNIENNKITHGNI